MGKALGRGLKSMSKKKSFKGLRALIRTSDEDENAESGPESEYKGIKSEYNKKKQQLMKKRDTFYQLKKDIVFNQLKEDADLDEDKKQLALLEEEIQDLERQLDKILYNMTKIEKDLKTDDGQDLVTVRQDYIEDKDIDQGSVIDHKESNKEENEDKPLVASSEIKDTVLLGILKESAFDESEVKSDLESGEVQKPLDDIDPESEAPETSEVQKQETVMPAEVKENPEYSADIKDKTKSITSESQIYEINTNDPIQTEKMPMGEKENTQFFEDSTPLKEEPALYISEEPESVVEEPEPVIEEPEPVIEEPESIIEEPEPVIEEPESVVEEPEPVIEEPEPVIEEPEPVIEEPESVIEVPEPVIEEPETTNPIDNKDDKEFFNSDQVAKEIEELEANASDVMKKLESGFKNEQEAEKDPKDSDEPEETLSLEIEKLESDIEELEPISEPKLKSKASDIKTEIPVEEPLINPIDDSVDDIELNFKFESKHEPEQPEEVQQLEKSSSDNWDSLDIVEYNQDDIESWKNEPEQQISSSKDSNSKLDAPKFESEFQSDKLYDDSKIKSKIDEIRGIEKGLVEVDNEISKLHNSLKENWWDVRDKEEDPEPFAERGDQVKVNYIGRFVDKTIFDTSIGSVARNETNSFTPTFNSDRSFSPLTFTVGSGQMVQGFDDGVQGMEVDETRFITVTPEKGYGEPDEGKIFSIPIVDSVPIFETQSRDSFNKNYSLETYPEPGVTFAHYFWGWPVKIISIDNDTVTLENDPAYGEEYTGFTWNTAITGISTTNNQIDLKHMVSFDMETLLISPDNFREYDPDVSENIAEDGVITVENNQIIVDFNKEVVGQTLIFEVTMIEITK